MRCVTAVMDRSLGRGSTLDLFGNPWGGSVFSSHGDLFGAVEHGVSTLRAGPREGSGWVGGWGGEGGIKF